MVSCHCRTALARMLSGEALESNLCRRLATNKLTLAVTTTFEWLNNAIALRHNAFATSESSNKPMFAFHLQASPYVRRFLSRLINLTSKDTNMVLSQNYFFTLYFSMRSIYFMVSYCFITTNLTPLYKHVLITPQLP